MYDSKTHTKLAENIQGVRTGTSSAYTVQYTNNKLYYDADYIKHMHSNTCDNIN